MTKLSDFSATRLLGAPEALSAYSGKVVLVVNVASACGKTPQYDGLEKLYRDYKDKGLVVLGFPCNQFGAQESGTDLEIATFCSTTYDVTFPMYRKIDVNGPKADPLYRWLKARGGGWPFFNAIKWNFTKFLVGRDGRHVERFSPDTQPASIVPAIEAALAI